ncbi:hypothetical protein ACQP2P_01795 [Dactylosporangium sp. CA-139114]|uniref:hypothetical protein n=1 Tax=Dactylosporangium sp. CA-139114 TaxID=3239931 RepID=UPI003D957E69
MTTPTTLATPAQPPVDYEAAAFAVQWLRGARHLAARSAPVIAVVQQLLAILRDESVPGPQAMLAARRAVRLLGALTGNARSDDRDAIEHIRVHDRVLDGDDVTRSAESVRFANHWLRGDPAEAIRTEPVVALVEGLLGSMLHVKVRPEEVYERLRRTVRVLSVLVREDRSAAVSSTA